MLKPMDLPPALRHLTELALEGVPLAELTRAAGTLSKRYRAEVHDGHLHLADDDAVRAYLVTRLPATYAAVAACVAAVAEARPDFAPRTLLDVGAGPGSAFWAAMERWPLEEALLLEASPAVRAWGERGTAHAPARVTWRTADVTANITTDVTTDVTTDITTDVTPGLADTPPHDLVTAAYLLNELAPEARARVTDLLWSLTADTLLLVEPGTPAGWTRILDARARLIAAGAHLLAPCPHAARCPLAPPDWCHFSQRVARSRGHRRAKGAEMAWEDEKYIYLAASRRPGREWEARVLAPPRARSGLVKLRLCEQDGTAAERSISKREGDVFRAARRAGWGDAL